MPPKAEEDRPYRGTRAGPKARKRRFYQIQDDLVEAGQRLFSVRVQKATFEEISDGHHTAVLEFNEAGGLRIDEEHLIWEDLAGYYPETREQLLRLPSAGVLLQAHQVLRRRRLRRRSGSQRQRRKSLQSHRLSRLRRRPQRWASLGRPRVFTSRSGETRCEEEGSRQQRSW